MHRYKEYGQSPPLKNGARCHGHLFNVEHLPLEELDAMVILRLQNQMAKVILTEMKYCSGMEAMAMFLVSALVVTVCEDFIL